MNRVFSRQRRGEVSKLPNLLGLFSRASAANTGGRRTGWRSVPQKPVQGLQQLTTPLQAAPVRLFWACNICREKGQGWCQRCIYFWGSSPMAIPRILWVWNLGALSGATPITWTATAVWDWLRQNHRNFFLQFRGWTQFRSSPSAKTRLRIHRGTE